MSLVRKKFHSWSYLYVYLMGSFIQIFTLTHLFPMHSFSTSCFQRVEKGCIGNEWVKATDYHQYLEYKLSLPDHTKKSIFYSQALRIGLVHLKKILRSVGSFKCDKKVYKVCENVNKTVTLLLQLSSRHTKIKLQQ